MSFVPLIRESHLGAEECPVKLGNGLENKPYEKQLRKLVLFGLKKSAIRGTISLFTVISEVVAAKQESISFPKEQTVR